MSNPEQKTSFDMLTDNLSSVVRKPDVCLCENKGADQLSAFVFTTPIVQFLFFVKVAAQAGLCQTWSKTPKYGFLIRKTCPCNLYPLIPHFYIAKLGYTGVYLFFLFLLQNIDCGYSLELTCIHNLWFEQK